MKEDLTPELIRQLLDYDPTTGEMYWRVATSGRRKVGQLAGVKEKTGYVRLWINGRRIRRHQAAWMHYHGRRPEHEIDHINGVYGDDRIVNLRDVPHHVNIANRSGPQKNNQTGFLGVMKIHGGKYFQARIQRNGKYEYLGNFSTPEAAYEKVLEARLSGAAEFVKRLDGVK
jgi:hypothetical protein